jgi:membrane protease YdiL (CAAX protease family)
MQESATGRPGPPGERSIAARSFAQMVGALLALAVSNPAQRATEGQWFFTLGGYLGLIALSGALALGSSWCVRTLRPVAVSMFALQAFFTGYALTETAFALFGPRLVLPVPAGALGPAVANLDRFALMRAYQIVAVVTAWAALAPLLREGRFRRPGDPRRPAVCVGVTRSWATLSLQIVALLAAAAAARCVLAAGGSFPVIDLWLVLAVTTGATINSCLEELLFRGVLLESLTRASGPRAAAHLTAALFAAMHGGLPLLVVEPALFAGTFALYYFLSLLFAWSVEDTGGIATACALHSAVAIAIRLFVLVGEGRVLP